MTTPTPTPQAEERCDVEFVDGRRCTKAPGHWTPQNGDVHTPRTTPDDAGLRQRIETALAEAGLACFSCTCATGGEDGCPGCAEDRTACADALLPLVAAERATAHEAGRVAGLREGANALQAVIDRDRAQFPHQRGQSWIALGGARQILLGLIDQQAGAVHQDGQP